MTRNRSVFRWLFWRTVYAFRPCPKTFEGVWLKGCRCWSPWWKFKPCVHRNDLGRHWEIWFEDEPSYSVARQTLTVTVMRSMADGHVTGIKVWDEHLKALAEPPKSIAG